MKITLMEFLSLDGVSQGPGAPDEDTSDGFTQGGWFVPHVDEAFMRLITDWVGQADAFLFGRRTYENFAGYWPKVTDPHDPFAAAVNGLPKYVASRSLATAEWAPSTILSGDVPAQVAQLKRQPGREVQIHGSARLAQSLLTAGLIDELRLVTAPVVLGHGRRLFPESSTPTGLRLLRSDATAAGLAVHVYEPTTSPEYGTYQQIPNAASPRRGVPPQ